MRFSSTGRAKSLAGKVPLAFTGSRVTIPEAQRTEQQTGVTRSPGGPVKGSQSPDTGPRGPGQCGPESGIFHFQEKLDVSIFL